MSSGAWTEWFSSPSIVLRLSAFGASALVAAGSLACGKPFNVKRQPDLPPANYTAKAAAASIVVQAQAMTDEDLLYDIFDANLIVAGVLAVRVMLTNSTEQNVDLQRARFQIRAASGRNYKAVKASEAFKRLISYYEISAYNKSGYKESLTDFSEYALDIKLPLAAGQSRQGLLFFLIPSDASRGAGLTLAASRLDTRQSGDTSVELKLN